MAFQVGELNAILRLEDRAFVLGLASSQRRFREFGLGLVKAGIAFGTALGVAIGGGILAAVRAAGRFEQTLIALEVLTGSAQAAKQLLIDLEQFAITTPFQLPELEQGVRLLRAYGFEVSELIPALRIFGDTTSALGLGAEGMERIILAFGQIKAKGVVQSEEMRQLANLGIPAWQILADTLGVTIPEAMDKVKKRQVDAATAIPALLEALQIRFGGFMERQSRTLLGIISNIRDVFTFIVRDIGFELIDAFNLKERSDEFMAELLRLRERISAVGLDQVVIDFIPDVILEEFDLLKTAISGVRGEFRDFKSEFDFELPPNLDKFFLRFGEFVTGISVLIGGAAIVTLFTSKVSLFIIGLSALGAGFTVAYEESAEFRRIVDGVINWFRTDVVEWWDTVAVPLLVDGIVEVATFFERNWPKIQAAGETVWNDFMIPFWNWIIEEFVPEVIEAWDRLVVATQEKLLPALRDFWTEIIQPAWEVFLTWWDENGDRILTPIQELLTFLIEDFGPDVIELVALIISSFNQWKEDNEIILGAVGAAWSRTLDVIISAFDLAVGLIIGSWDILVGILTSDWERVWDGAARIVEEVWDRIRSVVEDTINDIIVAINAMITAVNIALTGGVGFALGFRPIPTIPDVNFSRPPVPPTGAFGPGMFAIPGLGGDRQGFGIPLNSVVNNITVNNSPLSSTLREDIANALIIGSATSFVDKAGQGSNRLGGR